MSKLVTIAKVFSGMGLGLFMGASLQNYGRTNNIKEEIITMTNISAKDYSKLEARLGDVHEWQKALDSLKTKAAVDDAYFKGAQMVRDSIKTAAKAVK